MKKVTLVLTGLMLSAATYAQTWTLDKVHARVGFTITHMMVNDVEGNFKEIDATITSSKPDFSDAVFSFTAKANSIFTDWEQRDNHIKGPDFFDAEKYPTVSFQSKSIKKTGENSFKLTGDLTMHGVTKTVTLDGSYKGPIEHPMNKKMNAGFKLSGKINRNDFGIGPSMGTAILSNEVEINANGEFQKS